MSYCVSYTNGFYHKYKSSSKTPYQDWLDRNQADVIFKYSENYGDDCLYIYFEPAKSIIYIKGNFDYYDLDIITTLFIDNQTKTIKIDRIFCESINHWPDLFKNKSPSNGIGGISKYKQNIDFWQSQDITLDRAIKLFFGEWKLITPITRPFLDNGKELIEKYDDYFDNYRTGPWNHLIGKFLTDKNKAATIIQKYYRGWKIRLKYRNDPKTTLGKYLVMKMFKNICS